MKLPNAKPVKKESPKPEPGLMGALDRLAKMNNIREETVSVLTDPRAKRDALENNDSPYADGLWNPYRDGVTQSLLNKFLSCPEKLRLSFIEGMEVVDRDTERMDFGTFFHDCLDVIYTAFRDRESKDKTANMTIPGWVDSILPDLVEKTCNDQFDDRFELLQGRTGGTDWPTLELHSAIIKMLLEEYFDFWKVDWESMEWIALEKVFDVPYQNPTGYNSKNRPALQAPISIRGKWDGIVRIDGKLWLFETKTKGRIDEEVITDRLGLDLQVNMYLWAMEKVYGEKPAGVIYNVVRKPGEKLKQNEKRTAYVARVQEKLEENPSYYFMRPVGNVVSDDLLSFADEFHEILLSLEGWYLGGSHYRNSTSCTSGFGPCEYLRLCGANQPGLYRRKTVLFPELEQIPLK